MNPGNSAQNSSNTRSLVLYGVAAVVALIGLADAIYLTIQHITGESVRCTITSGCSEVLGSPYAVMFGVPLSELGAAAYFTVFALATLAAFQYKLAGRLMTIVVLLMFVMTLWLLYLQAFVIHHYCQFCLLSALVTTTLTALSLMAERSRYGVRWQA